MQKQVKVGIIGDFDPQKNSHPAINSALQHSAEYLALKIEVDWLPTPSFLQQPALDKLTNYDCLWVSSGSPFKSSEGTLKAIKRSRQLGKPLVGT
jgi:CTP synthase (UTP-ammonia lyase)